jgi:NAD(P)-dependent dehydrogenase (short-subunit alcohol dehydrogenase family)
MSDPLDFEGRVVVVTGGTRGVGRGITQAFLGSGAQVLVCGRTPPSSPADSASGTALPSASGREASFVQADVRDPEQAARVIATAVEQFGRIDVLVNNAGGAPSAPAADVSPRFVTAVVTLNLLAPFFCAQAANSFMQDQDSGGSVLNIGSVSGLRPSPGSAPYGAAKAGLINLTKTLAIEWAPKVRVNCVIGGLIATEAADLHYGGPSGMEAVAATVPLGRFGTPSDVAGTCLFLASPLAEYVSGASIEVHGGGESPPYLSALE